MKNGTFHSVYHDLVLTFVTIFTRLLLDTAMSPCYEQYNETLNTLRYAQQAKLIVNQPRINEVSQSDHLDRISINPFTSKL